MLLSSRNNEDNRTYERKKNLIWLDSCGSLLKKFVMKFFQFLQHYLIRIAEHYTIYARIRHASHHLFKFKRNKKKKRLRSERFFFFCFFFFKNNIFHLTLLKSDLHSRSFVEFPQFSSST